MSGKDLDKILVLVAQQYLSWLQNFTIEYQIATADFAGEITNVFPKSKLLAMITTQQFENLPIRSERPVTGLTVFTDAGKKSKKAVATWQSNGCWEKQFLDGDAGD